MEIQVLKGGICWEALYKAPTPQIEGPQSIIYFIRLNKKIIFHIKLVFFFLVHIKIQKWVGNVF